MSLDHSSLLAQASIRKPRRPVAEEVLSIRAQVVRPLAAEIQLGVSWAKSHRGLLHTKDSATLCVGVFPSSWWGRGRFRVQGALMLCEEAKVSPELQVREAN